jgi:hypothetical protein
MVRIKLSPLRSGQTDILSRYTRLNGCQVRLHLNFIYSPTYGLCPLAISVHSFSRKPFFPSLNRLPTYQIQMFASSMSVFFLYIPTLLTPHRIYVQVSSNGHRYVPKNLDFRTLDDFNTEFADAWVPSFARYCQYLTFN